MYSIVSGSKTYVCTILDFFASAPTVPGAFFLEIQVIFGRVRLFLGDSGYFWEIQVIIGRVYYGLAVETYNPLTHMLEVGC